VKVLYCRSCQTENRTTARYCDRCGAPLVPTEYYPTTDRLRLFNVRPVLYGAAALLLLWLAFHAYNFYESHSDAIKPASDLQPPGTLDHPVTSEPKTVSPTLPQPLPTNPAVPDNVPTPSELERESQEAAEKAAQAAARAQAAAQQGAQIASAIHAIRLKIYRSWIRPVTSKKDLKCRVKVRLMPDGSVINAEIISSSGDEAFDTSAQNAVIQASPLPVPTDKNLFERSFRSFTFTFTPS
jgi:TonB family protein